MSGDLPKRSKLVHGPPLYVKRAKTTENCHRRPLLPKTEVEIWRKPQKMNSQLGTSYSTFYTLWGLSQRYLTFLRRNLTTGPIIQDVGLFAEICAQKRTINHV